MNRILAIALAAALLLLVAVVSATAENNESPLFSPQDSSLSFLGGFPITLTGSGHIRSSSIALGDVNNDGFDDIVVGDTAGVVHAYSHGGNRLWTYDTGEMAIESKAAVGDLDGDGWNEIVVAAGSTINGPAHGGLYVLDRFGGLRCAFNTGDFNTDGYRDGVYSSPAIVDIDRDDGGRLEIVFGAWDAHIRVLNDDCSVVWDYFNRDSVWSSPAVGDLDRDGYLDIVIGSDSHDEPNLVPPIFKGGRLHAFDRLGNSLPGFPKHMDEVIFSSPALADLNEDGWLEIVAGTGHFWANPDCGHPQGCTPGVGKYVSAWDHAGNPLPGWPVYLEGYTWGSPAIANMDDDVELEVVINASDARVHVLNPNGTAVPGWPKKPVTPATCTSTVSFATNASPIVADVTGDGYPEILLASNWELVVWDREGNQLTRTSGCPANAWDLSTPFTLNSSPAVTDLDQNGSVDVLIGGATSNGGAGAIYAWNLSGAAAEDSFMWPMFRRNALNHGLAWDAPSLIVSPAALVVMVEQGGAGDFQAEFAVRNGGDGMLLWTATPDDNRLQASPDWGYADGGGASFTLSVDTAGLNPGSHDYELTVAGTLQGLPVEGSPFQLPAQVIVVNELHRTLLPVISLP